MRYYTLLFSILFLCVFSGHVIAENSQPGIQVAWFSDETRIVSFEEARSLNYQALENGLLKVGYSKNAEWLKISVDNPSSEVYERILYLSKGTADSVTFFYQQDGQWKRFYSGTFIADLLKPIQGPGICFPLTIHENTNTFYMRLVSTCSKQQFIRLIDSQEKEHISGEELLINGIYIGALLIISLYNIFLGFSVRDKIYYHYALANMATLFGILATQGALDNILPDNFARFTPAFLGMIHAIWAVMTVNFSIRILDIRKYSKPGYYLLLGSSAFMVFNIMIYIFLPIVYPPTVYKLLPVGALVYSICSILAGYHAVKKGSTYSRYYLVGWSAFFGGIILLALVYSGVIEKNWFTANAYWVASIFEVLMLSFALADRYKFMQKERDRLKENLKHKEDDLSMVINDNRLRHQFRKHVLEGIEEISQAENGELRSKLNSFIMDIKFQVETEEKQNFIQDNISEINSKFDEILKSNYPNLNASEREICQLIKLNLSVKEIARIRKISEGAVKASRHRIKKKMNLESLESLQKL